MSGLLQSLLSSAFPNVKPPEPRGRSVTTAPNAPGPVPEPAIADLGPDVAPDAVAPDAFDTRAVLVDTLGSEEVVTQTTLAVIILATVWLVATWYLLRRRRRAKAAAAAVTVAQGGASSKRNDDEVIRETVLAVVDERSIAFEERIQRTLAERIINLEVRLHKDHEARIDAEKKEGASVEALRVSIDEQLGSLQKRLEEAQAKHDEAREQNDTILGDLQKTLSEQIKNLEDDHENTSHTRIETIQKDFEKALQDRTEETQEKFEKALNDRTEATQDNFEKVLSERTEAMEESFEKTFSERIETIQENFEKILNDRLEAIEESVRRRVNQRLEALETRIKLDQEAIEDLHKAISQRMEILEEGVRIIDGKQLDQEAAHVTHRSLNSRLEAVEGSLQALENKTRATSQRIEAIDDSSRVIDSRTKALSQRVEAVEDNLSATDGQVTLLSHDAGRGVDAIEKLQKQVKSLPGNERLRELTIAWEERFNELESRTEQAQLALEDAHPEPTLSWSHIESVEIEPVGPIYTRPSYNHAQSWGHSPTLSFDGSLPPTPSSSGRSYSFSSSNTQLTTPTHQKRRRIDTAGFTDTTFSSRQKLFAARQQHSRKNSYI